MRLIRRTRGCIVCRDMESGRPLKQERALPGIARLWQGAEGYFDPEISGGEGFGGVTGAAGFPNGDIQRVGTPEPEPYVARLYLRQDFGFRRRQGKKIDPGGNMLGRSRDIDRLSLYVGKFSIYRLLQ